MPHPNHPHRPVLALLTRVDPDEIALVGSPAIQRSFVIRNDAPDGDRAERVVDKRIAVHHASRLDLMGRTLDAFTSELAEAVRKQHDVFGATHPWDIYVESISEGELAVYRWSETNSGLLVARWSATAGDDGGIIFTFTDIEDGVVIYARVSELAAARADAAAADADPAVGGAVESAEPPPPAELVDEFARAELARLGDQIAALVAARDDLSGALAAARAEHSAAIDSVRAADDGALASLRAVVDEIRTIVAGAARRDDVDGKIGALDARIAELDGGLRALRGRPAPSRAGEAAAPTPAGGSDQADRGWDLLGLRARTR